MKEKPQHMINKQQEKFIKNLREENEVWEDMFVFIEKYTKELDDLFKTGNKKVSK